MMSDVHKALLTEQPAALSWEPAAAIDGNKIREFLNKGVIY